MKNQNLLSRYMGCLIGGAVGDALGYTVEFMNEEQIFSRFGNNGITEYSLKNGVAEISDDTQMTLFTAAGILFRETRGCARGIAGPSETYIYKSYKDWLKTQQYTFGDRDTEGAISWLVNEKQLYSRRAPGNTCLSALQQDKPGTIEMPINNSKGCGGIMRVAPIGLFFGRNEEMIKETDMIGAKAAALTHGHELGYIPAAALTHIVAIAAHSNELSLREIITDAVKTVSDLFKDAKHISEFNNLMNKAIKLSATSDNDLDAIHSLGEGWVAEETLAIAVYCALKYSDNFEKAIIAAVNHKGDSDSTGAVCGNILGSYLGIEHITQKYTDNLELLDVLYEIANDLFTGCDVNYDTVSIAGVPPRKKSTEELRCEEIWNSKYIYHTFNMTQSINVPNMKASTDKNNNDGGTKMASKLLLSDLLTLNGIDPKDVLLIRHALSDPKCRKCYEQDFIHEYTQLQTTKTMTKHKYWMAFVSTKETKAKFIGMYKYQGKFDISEHQKLSGFPCPEMYNDDHVFYQLEKTEIFKEWENCLIIDWGGSARSWYQNATNEKPVVAIQSSDPKTFIGFDELVLEHSELEAIVNDVSGEYQNYRASLSSVKGVYLILDTKTGDQYIGSAYGEDGILGRWRQYANPPYNGGNKELIILMNKNKDYYKYFQFCILQIFSKSATKEEIINTESLFKRKLGSKVFGLNDN